MSRSDRPRAHRRDHQRFERLGAHHPLTQQRGREHLVGVAQLRTLQRYRAARGLDRQIAVAVALPDPLTVGPRVPVTAQPGRDLVLEDLLEHQAGRQPHHLLQDLADLTARPEQLVDLGTDALSGRYSSWQG